MKDSRAPLIIAIVLLILPTLYVGSYLALVVPSGRAVPMRLKDGWDFYDYRLNSDIPSRIFWPLEQIHRRLQPDAWRQFRSLYDPPIQE